MKPILVTVLLVGILLAACSPQVSVPQTPAYPAPLQSEPTQPPEATLPAYPAPGGSDAAPVPSVSQIPNGGLFTWVTFPAGLDMAAFQRDVLIPQAGVIVVPGTPFFADRPEANHARMSYSGVPDDRLVEGVRRMLALLTDALR